jgi:hypothetical protein
MSEKAEKAKIINFTKEADGDDFQLDPSFDIYDPANYDIDQAEALPAERKLKVKLRRPHKMVFIRAADPDFFRFKTRLLRFEDREDVYNIVPHLWADLEEDSDEVDVFLLIDLDGVLYLWSIPRNSDSDWYTSARQAVEEARERWVRIVSVRVEGRYKTVPARSQLEDPVWPDLRPRDFLEAGFKGRTITSLQHDAIARLRGSK